LGILITTTSDFSYFGILSSNTLNETTAISSIGLLSSQSGIEDLVFFKESGQISWYYGEYFSKKIKNLDLENRSDYLNFANTPYNIFGDIPTPPHMATPHDDHNWLMSETLENSYFDKVRGLQTQSNTNSYDTLKYWPVDRNSYLWFGEFLENDLYYGWSHQVLIDTETYFDYSPYSLTNVFGDGLLRGLVTDILTMFVGPVELDQSSLLNLNDWGANYSAGFRTNRVSGGESSGFENESTLDLDQRIRENGESYHE
jgi:hypothetical protein